MLTVQSPVDELKRPSSTLFNIEYWPNNFFFKITFAQRAMNKYES